LKLLLYRFVRCLIVLCLLGGLSGPSCFAAAPVQYTADGTPTGLEEEIRWRVNRGRFDTASENQTRGTAYTDVPASTGPLAPNQSLTVAARHQSEDLAKNNLFQHETVPGSAYYNPTTQPEPWDRMQAEGYSWNYAGENIAAGYSGAEAAYVGWWNSTGHRQNMYNSAFREIGDGYYYWSASAYRNYYTMDLGNSGSTCFFTDTLFHDSNTNGLYDQAEGISGVAITLLIGGVPYSYFDLSSTVGSFAIPIQSIATAASAQVILSNTTAASVVLSIPRDYRNCTTVALAPGESRVFGVFTKPSGARNVGFRDVTQTLPPIIAPRLVLVSSGTNVVLTWPSENSVQYLPQHTTNFLTWSNLTAGYLTGIGSNMTWLDPASGGGNRRFYRLLIHQP
jgi:Cysteine-rich secretory protein family